MATETSYPNTILLEPGKGVICNEGTTGSPGGSCDCDVDSSCLCCATCSLDEQSARFRAWDSLANVASSTSVQLKFDWVISWNAANACDTAQAYAEYSRDGASTWNACSGFPKTITGGSSGTSTTNMTSPTSFTTGNFRVRVWIDAVCDEIECSFGGCSFPSCGSSKCDISLDINNLRVINTYPIGACCVSCGVCQSGKTPATCTGSFQGDGTTCSPNPCTAPTGACCDGVGGCTIKTQASCEGGGDTWQGCGSTCSPNPCALPTGSCCDGGVCTETIESACAGTWTESGTCSPDPCVAAGGAVGMVFSFGF